MKVSTNYTDIFPASKKPDIQLEGKKKEENTFVNTLKKQLKTTVKEEVSKGEKSKDPVLEEGEENSSDIVERLDIIIEFLQSAIETIPMEQEEKLKLLQEIVGIKEDISNGKIPIKEAIVGLSNIQNFIGDVDKLSWQESLTQFMENQETNTKPIILTEEQYQGIVKEAVESIQNLRKNIVAELGLKGEGVGAAGKTLVDSLGEKRETSSLEILKNGIVVSESGKSSEKITHLMKRVEQGQFAQNLAQVKENLQKQQGTAVVVEESVDIETLQLEVNEGKFLNPNRTFFYEPTGDNIGAEEVQKLKPQILEQVKNQILSQNLKDVTEFSMKLKPDGLGDIMIKIIQSQDKLTLDIMASNKEVNKLISSEIFKLQDALKTVQTQLVEIKTHETTENAGLREQFESFDKNFGAEQERRENQERYKLSSKKEDTPEIVEEMLYAPFVGTYI